jgi:polysaccharide export outer membrane protein
MKPETLILTCSNLKCGISLISIHIIKNLGKILNFIICGKKIMRGTLLEKIFGFALVFAFLAVGQIFAQETQPTKVNFGQSRNPKTKAKKETPQTQETQSNQTNTNDVQTNSEAENTNAESLSVASKTLEVVKRANTEAIAPTEIYKVGIGDVLFISLQNAPSSTANYFTVLNNGSIDYPLAGEMVLVAGMTVEEIEDSLKSKIKLYENPQVSVKLREYASHSITVLGLVEKSGQKFLQREAIPLYVVRAEAVVQAKAERVIIKRADSTTEKFDLKDSKYENILVFPGDIIEFTMGEGKSLDNPSSQYFYIGGNINSAGQKTFTNGMTLTQAILASGGLKKSSAKKVIIRRKNEQGLLVSSEYNLKDIKDGKSPDPILQAGDTIEIEN